VTDAATDAIDAHSAAAIAKGSTSFAAASRLFGRALRQDAAALYAWCRHCDDAIDGQDHGHGMTALTDAERRTRLDLLRQRTLAALAGEAMEEPAFAAFQRVALKHRFPAAWPLALLDGFAMDVEGREYRVTEQTLDYCWGVAGVVGVMMAAIMGVREQAVLARAQDLGLAFQITNICRDIREDAEHGRLYLPAERCGAAGLGGGTGEVLDPRNQAALFAVVRGLLTLAEDYYSSSRAGLRDLPFRGALAVAAARGIYREIGRRILRGGPDTLARRMQVPKPVMGWLLLRGSLVAVWSRVDRFTPKAARPPLWSKI
jgi:phytoene synthase